MNDISRHHLIAAAVGGAVPESASAAQAHDPLASQRGSKGADILGPKNLARGGEEPKTLAPPGIDHGTMPNLNWLFADSRMRLE